MVNSYFACGEDTHILAQEFYSGRSGKTLEKEVLMLEWRPAEVFDGGSWTRLGCSHRSRVRNVTAKGRPLSTVNVEGSRWAVIDTIRVQPSQGACRLYEKRVELGEKGRDFLLPREGLRGTENKTEERNAKVVIICPVPDTSLQLRD